MKNAVNVYITPSGRQVLVPDPVMNSTKFTKLWEPDKRHAGNALFVAWAKAQDDAVFEPDWFDAATEEVQ